MYQESKVITYGGSDMWLRMQRKLIGGRANDDGSKMEHFFSVFKIIELAADIYAGDFTGSGNDHIWYSFLCLVDDLKIETDTSLEYYQLKCGRVRLTEVLKDIEDQAHIDKMHGVNALYVVVVSTERRAVLVRNRAKAKSIPATAIVFPFGRKWQRFTERQPTLRLNLRALIGTDDEKSLEHVYRVISACWLEVEDQRIADLFDEVTASTGFLFERNRRDTADFLEFAETIKVFGFDADYCPRLVISGHNATFTPVVECEPKYFNDFTQWLKSGPRSPLEVMGRLSGVV